MKTIKALLARGPMVAFFALVALAGPGRAGLQAAPASAWRPAEHSFAPTPQLQPSALLQTEEGSGERRKELFEWINFLLVTGLLVYLLRKPFANFLADRLETIREDLDQGRKALAGAEAKLAEIEKKLANVQEEIAAFRVESEREMQVERERMRQAAEREGERILAFAGVQTEAAVRAARLELKRYAAGQALEVAEALVRQRLDEPARRGLVSAFVAGLKSSGAQN